MWKDKTQTRSIDESHRMEGSGSKSKRTLNSKITLRTLDYGSYGIFLIMGNAGFISSTVVT